MVEAVALTIFLAGTGGSVALAQHSGHGVPVPPSPAAPVVQTGKLKGKVVDFDPTSITLETQKKGRTERVICLIGAGTKTRGDLQIGADVVVKYREEAGNKMATSIEVKKTK